MEENSQRDYSKTKKKDDSSSSDGEFHFPMENEEVVDSDEERRRYEDDMGGKYLPQQLHKHLEFDFFGGKVLLKQDPTESCGGYIWRSAMVMLNYLENEKNFKRDHFKSKKVLEVGAGTGLVGIAMAKFLGCYSMITDQKSMIPLIQENIKVNNLTEESSIAAELFWGVTDCSSFKTPSIDYIIAADCIYLEIAFAPLVSALSNLCDSNTEVILSTQKRRKADKRFWTLAKKKFDVTKIPTNSYSNLSTEKVSIFHLKLKPKKTPEKQEKQNS